MTKMLLKLLLVLAASASYAQYIPPPYNAASVAITGGTIDGAVIGGVTPAAGTFQPLTDIGLFSVKDGTDPTKIGTFSAVNITTGTTRAYTLPNIAGQLAVQSSGNASTRVPYVATDGISYTHTGAFIFTVASGTIGATNLTLSGVASSGAAQTGYLCYNTTGGVITYDGGATCLVSREEYKDNLGAIKGALTEVMALKPFWGRYKEGTPMGDHHVQPFFGARYTASVDKRLTSFDKQGEPLGVRYENMSAVLVAAVQEQQRMIVALRRELKALKGASSR